MALVRTKSQRASLFLIQLLIFSLSANFAPTYASTNAKVCSTGKYPSMTVDEKITIPHFHLTAAQKKAFHRDGYIIIRGLLKDEELENAILAMKEMERKKTLVERAMNGSKTSPYNALKFQTWRDFKEMEQVAFDSAIPSLCAQLMGLDEQKDRNSNFRPMRLLKDAFLTFSPGDIGCGWHVDDKVFWPCEDTPNNKQKDSGINVWITLSPLKASKGGGLALSRGSHRVSWREKARSVIKVGGPRTTCNMAVLSPKYNAMLEKRKVLEDMQPGDAILHDRYCYHRPERFISGEGDGSLNEDLDEYYEPKSRISLRYVPADAHFEANANLNIDSVIQEKGLQQGDLISKGGEYFPQVWPNSLVQERECVGKLKEDLNLFSFASFSKTLMRSAFGKKTKKEEK